MKRRLRRPFSIGFTIASILLLIATVVTISVIFWNSITQPNTTDIEDPKDDNIQTFDYSVNSYTLFDLDEFEFRFILADIHIESNKPINISLSSFKTSETIQLNSINNYLNFIEQAGYNFGSYEVVFGLSSENQVLDATIFIPIIDSSLSFIDVDINLNPAKTLSFDLSNPNNMGTINDLGINETNINPEDVAVVSFNRDTMVEKEQFYQLDSNGNRIPAIFTSQSLIYGVSINIENQGTDKFRITNAFLHSTNGATYLAIDKSYLVDGVDNLNNLYIEKNETGFLFFEVLGQDLTTESFSSLDIYFSNIESNIPYAFDLVENH